MAVTSQASPSVSGGVITRISGWAATPVTSQVDLGTVALGLVLTAIVAFLWTRVLRHIVTDVVKDIPT